MNALVAAGTTAGTIAILTAVASERMRSHGLAVPVLDVRTVAVAAAGTLARVWLAWRGVGDIATSIAFAVATVAAITDLRCGYVFDRTLLAGGIGIFAVALGVGHAAGAFAGAAIAALLLAIPWAVSRARGIGLGDVKLAAVLGLALGPYDAMRAVWFAFVIGALVGVAYVLTKRRSRNQTLPFAPFLGIGAVLSAGGTAW